MPQIYTNKNLCLPSCQESKNNIVGMHGLFFAVAIAVIVFLMRDPEGECMLEVPHEVATKLFRAPEKCDFCIDIERVERISNQSPEKIYWNFLALSRPLVLDEGARNWRANEMFSFEFFKRLYNNMSWDTTFESCQFFAYKTSFSSLREVFAMDDARARLENGTQRWYVGWSNCNYELGKQLKNYYDISSFLSNMTENLALSWTFIGGAGPGAQMHVDNVNYPSWQAQIHGTKKWILAPPPECYYKCQPVTTIINPGNIIVLDTNRWYHRTVILNQDLSISIGAEFD